MRDESKFVYGRLLLCCKLATSVFAPFVARAARSRRIATASRLAARVAPVPGALRGRSIGMGHGRESHDDADSRGRETRMYIITIRYAFRNYLRRYTWPSGTAAPRMVAVPRTESTTRGVRSAEQWATARTTSGAAWRHGGMYA